MDQNIQDLLRPLESVQDAMSRPSVRRSLENNLLDVSAWELMRIIESENMQVIAPRKLLQVLLGDNPDLGDIDIVEKQDSAQMETLDNSIVLLQVA
ncbi:hypothetical protein EV182_002645 [Spiromyces aspiralis]|uniref:Uncharacterized protein n=1 Tax=Spiromyces aspiralis TaxID=68401 RepID=A0ACC1HG92_9FUNG|nr:hypothetical protein EV182_002645 [Spiromyces aspiralis]